MFCFNRRKYDWLVLNRRGTEVDPRSIFKSEFEPDPEPEPDPDPDPDPLSPSSQSSDTERAGGL
jgi:hypothetical protein